MFEQSLPRKKERSGGRGAEVEAQRRQEDWQREVEAMQEQLQTQEGAVREAAARSDAALREYASRGSAQFREAAARSKALLPEVAIPHFEKPDTTRRVEAGCPGGEGGSGVGGGVEGGKKTVFNLFGGGSPEKFLNPLWGNRSLEIEFGESGRSFGMGKWDLYRF